MCVVKRAGALSLWMAPTSSFVRSLSRPWHAVRHASVDKRAGAQWRRPLDLGRPPSQRSHAACSTAVSFRRPQSRAAFVLARSAARARTLSGRRCRPSLPLCSRLHASAAAAAAAALALTLRPPQPLRSARPSPRRLSNAARTTEAVQGLVSRRCRCRRRPTGGLAEAVVYANGQQRKQQHASSAARHQGRGRDGDQCAANAATRYFVKVVVPDEDLLQAVAKANVQLSPQETSPRFSFQKTTSSRPSSRRPPRAARSTAARATAARATASQAASVRAASVRTGPAARLARRAALALSTQTQACGSRAV